MARLACKLPGPSLPRPSHAGWFTYSEPIRCQKPGNTPGHSPGHCQTVCRSTVHTGGPVGSSPFRRGLYLPRLPSLALATMPRASRTTAYTYTDRIYCVKKEQSSLLASEASATPSPVHWQQSGRPTPRDEFSSPQPKAHSLPRLGGHQCFLAPATSSKFRRRLEVGEVSSKHTCFLSVLEPDFPNCS